MVGVEKPVLVENAKLSSIIELSPGISTEVVDYPRKKSGRIQEPIEPNPNYEEFKHVEH